MKKQDVSQKTFLGIRLFMIWLTLSMSVTQVFAVSIDTTSIVETEYYRSAIIDFETDEDALTFIELNDGVNSQLIDVSTIPTTNHSVILRDLDPDKTYDYILSAQSPTVATDSDNTPSRTFRTDAFSSQDLELSTNIPEFYGAALFQVKGRTLADVLVTLYKNGVPIDNSYADYKGEYESLSFRFDTDLAENTLQIVAYDEASGQTWTSEEYIIAIDVEQPVLTLDTIPEVYDEDALDVKITVNEDVLIDAAVTYEDDQSNPYVVEEDLEVQAGEAIISFPLDERLNTITIRATDKSGNFVQRSEEIFVDTIDPTIDYVNLNEISPSYSSQVTIKGEVSEPNIRIQVFVNPDENNFLPCSDGEDNDGDGLFDYGEDPGCDSPEDFLEDNPPLGSGSTQCNDGIDNPWDANGDGVIEPDEGKDGLIDYLEDPGCTSLNDNNEAKFHPDYNNTRTECNDGIDNDNDGRADFLGYGTGKPGDRGCSSQQDNSEDSENSRDFFETFSDANGAFSVDVELDDEFSFYSGIGVENMQGLDPYTNAGAENADNGVGIGLEYENTKVNDIRIVATDRAGRRDEYEGEVTLATCGGGGEWNVVLGNIYPGMLQPDLIFQGLGQFSMEMDFDFFGDDPTGSVQIHTIDYNLQRLSEVDEEDIKPHQMLENPGAQCTFSPQGGFSDSTFVVCDLSPWPPEHRRNITAGYERLEDIGEVEFPLELQFSYSYTNSRGEPITKVHRECQNVIIGVDRRIPPDFIPSKLLNSTVNFLTDVIEAIDRLLIPLRTAKLVTMGACFGTIATQFMVSLTNVASCAGLSGEQKDAIKQVISGCGTGSCQDKLDEHPALKDSDKSATIRTCANTIKSDLEFEEFRNYVCDRIFCPAVPSAQSYIKEVNEQDNQASACSLTEGNPWIDSARVDGPSGDKFTKKEGCGLEYDNLYGPSCLIYDPVDQSKELERDAGDSRGIGTISAFMNNLRFCQSAQRNNQSQHIVTGDTTLYQDREGDYDCYRLGVNQQLSAFSPSSSLANQRTIDPNSKQQSVTPAPIAEGSSFGSCVETSKTGELIYQLQGQRLTENGNAVGDVGYLEYDAENAKPISYQVANARENGIAQGSNPDVFQRSVTQYQVNYGTETNPDYRTIGIDNDGNYYDMTNSRTVENTEVFTQVNPRTDTNGEIFSVVCKDRSVAGVSSYSVYQRQSNQENEPGNTEVISNRVGSSNADCSVVEGPPQAERDQVKDILIDPTSNIINAVRCVCIPAIEGFLIVWRNVLTAIKNCFQSVLLTGEFQAGACRALLTEYLCDLIYEAIKCFFNASSLTAKGAGIDKSDSGPLGAFSRIQEAGSKVGNSIDSRYGDTASYKNLISSRRLLHAVCLAAFGYDFIPELDQALSIQGGGFSIQSVGGVPTAERRLARINPQDGGKVTFIYDVGYFLSAGSNVNWRVEMKCSNDFSCSQADGFEGGQCDCSYPANQNAEGRFNNPYIIDAGSAPGGTFVGDADGNGQAVREITAPIRYDKVRLVWTDTTQGNNSGATDWKHISAKGDILPISCYISPVTWIFGCDHSSQNSYGDVFFEEPGVSFAKPTREYYRGETLTFSVFARQGFEGVKPFEQVQKYAKAKLKSGSTTIKEWVSLHGALATPPVVFGDYTFGAGETVDQLYGVSRSTSTFASRDIIPFNPNSVNDATSSAKNAGYYVWTQCGTPSETSQWVEDNQGITVSAQNVCRFAYRIHINPNSESTMDNPIQTVNFAGNDLIINIEGGTQSVSSTQYAQVKQLTDGSYEVLFQNGVRLTILENSVETIDSFQVQYLPFTRETSFGTSALCQPGNERVTLKLEVSLHDGDSLYGDSNPNAYEGKPKSVVFEYNGAPQSREYDITLVCSQSAGSNVNAQGVPVQTITQTCDEGRVLSQFNNCLCGPQGTSTTLFATEFAEAGAKVCISNAVEDVCSINTVLGTNENGCVCANIGATGVTKTESNTCSTGQTCSQSAGFTCVSS